jgi:hypothetical protein
MPGRAVEGSILWTVRRDAPFAPYLVAFGLHPDRVIFCRCRNDAEMLAVLEDALGSKDIAAAIDDAEHATLTRSWRLHLICEVAGNIGLLLLRRFHGMRAERNAEGSAGTRWRVAFTRPTMPSPASDLRRRPDLLYCRGVMPAYFFVEWNDEAHHLHLLAKRFADLLPRFDHAMDDALTQSLSSIRRASCSNLLPFPISSPCWSWSGRQALRGALLRRRQFSSRTSPSPPYWRPERQEHCQFACCQAGDYRSWLWYPNGVPRVVKKQIENELTLIGKLEYAFFFLTVDYIVQYAKSQDIPHQG